MPGFFTSRIRAAVFGASLVIASFGVGSFTPNAHASISIAASYEGLVSRAQAAVVITPTEEMGVWEDGKIITYTRVHVDRGIAGELRTGADAWVRTRGGKVGNIGQLVEGEAVFVVGRPSLLFLQRATSSVYEVTSRAQGQFPIRPNEKQQLRVMKSSTMGMLVAPKPGTSDIPKEIQSRLAPQSAGAGAHAVAIAARLATDVIHDRPLEDVAREIAADWNRLHGQ